MDIEADLMGKTLYTATEVSRFVLKQLGTVLPFALTFDPSGDNARTYYPRDQMRDAGWQELLDAAIDHLVRRIAAGDVGSIALVTTLESGEQSGLGVQVETRWGALMWIYPYQGAGTNRTLEEGSQAKDLLVGPLLCRRLPLVH